MMDKIAQRRSLRSKVLEKIHIPGMGAEMLSPTFKAIMKEMRNTDKQVREIADPAKLLVRQMKSGVRRRDYLEAALYLSDFHNRMRHAAHLLGKFLTSSPILQREELIQNFKNPNKEKLFQYDPNAEIKDAAIELDSILKEAGIKDKFLDLSDFISDTGSNMFSGKGLARRHMEKRFSDSMLREMKEMTKDMVSESNELTNTLLNTLDKMETGVSRRNVDIYKNHAQEFINAFNSYHKKFLAYDTKVIKPFREQYAQMIKAQEDASKAAEDARKKEREDAFQKFHEERMRQEKDRLEREQKELQEAQKSPFVTPYNEDPRKAPYTELSFNEWKNVHSPSVPKKEDVLQEIEKEFDQSAKNQVLNKLEHQMGTKAHEEFMERMTVLADENNVPEFIQEVLNYSEFLEASDEEASADLLMLAGDVVNNYKTAGIFDVFKGKPKEEKPAAVEVKKKDKPQELIQQREDFLRLKKIDLPEGSVDKAYTDIPSLAAVGASQIRITPDTARTILNSFARRLAEKMQWDSLEQHIGQLESNIIPVIKQAVYDSWIISAGSVSDSHNPRDKYIDAYSRVALSDLIPELNGVAKLHISCRVSADHGTVTVRGIKKHFDVEVHTPEEEAPVGEDDSEDIEFDDDPGVFDYPSEFYDDGP